MKLPILPLPSFLRLKRPSKSSIDPPSEAQVFNRPVNTQRSYRLARTLYAILLAVLLALACAAIALKAVTIVFIEDNRNTGFYFMTADPVGETLLAALPKRVYFTPSKIALVAAVMSFFAGVGHVVFLVMDWQRGERTQTYAFRRNAMFLHFANALLALFSLVSLSVTHKSSSHFHLEYLNRKANLTSPDDAVRYAIGTFDLETWACELMDVPGASMVRTDYMSQCNVEVGGRAVVVVLMVVAWGLAGVSVWQMISCGVRDAEGERMATEDVEVEMGKFNAM